MGRPGLGSQFNSVVASVCLSDELKHLTKRLHEKGVDVATEKRLKMVF